MSILLENIKRIKSLMEIEVDESEINEEGEESTDTTTDTSTDTSSDTGTVTNTMLAGSIDNSKLATDPLARANHTGTQLASIVIVAGAVITY